MAAMSDYLENAIIDHTLRGQTFTPPTTIYVALFTTTPADAGGGVEVSGGSYARVAVAASLAAWAGTQAAGSTTASTGTSGTTSNNAAVIFPTASTGWGTVVAFGLFDAASAGNLLYYGALISPRAFNTGDTAVFLAGALTLQDDN